MPAKPNTPKPRRRPAAVLAALVAAVVLAFVSSAFSPASGSKAERKGGGEPASRERVVSSSDPITAATAKPSTALYPTGLDNDEISDTGAEPVSPCRLVPRNRVSAILDGRVTATEAPQGPTCVFTRRGAARHVTLTVEAVSIAGLRRHARGASSVRPAGRAGWCLRYETTAVAVPLGDGRVLSVTGPCAAATRIAAQALPRLGP